MDREQQPFKTSLCSEYEDLLYTCKACLDEFREEYQKSAETDQQALRKTQKLAQLRERYERAYARLVNHFEACELCHVSEKSRDKTPPSPGRIIPFKRRSA